ncbi:MAG: YHS domain-containing protein [Deltaproteobacteria bacterium]|nr:YHS domain-containing protein [Deltaproteobacteria bacterium]
MRESKMTSYHLGLFVAALSALALGAWMYSGTASAHDNGCDHGWSDACGLHAGNHGDHSKAHAKPPKFFDKAPKVGTKATCPVTGNELTVTKDTKRSVYKGKHVVFCCPGCKPMFDADPKKYLGK